MLRYFVFAVGIAIASYVALRLTVGSVILPMIDPRVAADTMFIVPGVVAVICGAVFLRPLVRAQTLLGPILAVLAYPFVAGIFCSIGLTVFGGSETEDFLSTFEGTFAVIRAAPVLVVESVIVTIPLAAVAIFLLRRSDPPETLKKRNLATVDPYAR